MKPITIPAWVKGTLLEEILTFDITKKNAFSDELPSVEKTDKAIGPMSDYEKVLLTLLNQKNKELKELKEKDPDPENFDVTRESDRKASQLAKETAALGKMMWASINYKIKTSEGDKIALRKGFTVVHARHTAEEAFQNLMDNLGSGMIVVGMHRM